jgi:hypothetical protein
LLLWWLLWLLLRPEEEAEEAWSRMLSGLWFCVGVGWWC